MKRQSQLPLLNLIAAVFVVIVNALANIIPFNGQNTGAVSDGYPVLFTPAGYVFAIWGVIYVGLLAFGAHQYLTREEQNRRLQRPGLLFILSCVCNGAWLFFWHHERFGVTLLLMLMLLCSLILIYEQLEIGRRHISRRERWLVQIPFSIYLGWISVATIANVSVLLYAAGWGGWGIGPQAWTILMLVITAALGVLMSINKGDLVYNLVLAWSFVGIALKPSSPQLISGIALALSAVLILVWLILRYGLPDIRTLAQSDESS